MLQITAARLRVYLLKGFILLICLRASVAEPLTPVGAWPGYFRGWPQSVEVLGTRVYISAGLGGMIIVDATDPANPVRIGGFQTFNQDEASRVKISGNRAFIAGRPDLTVVDISNPSKPTFVGRYGGGRATGMDVSGEKAYLTTTEGFKIVDPVVAGGTYPIIASDVQVVGSTAYLAGSNSGLVILDVSNSAAPQKLGEFKTIGSARAVKIVGNRAYVAADVGGLEILDISNPSIPVRLGRYGALGNAYGVSVEGNVAVVADLYRGVTVIDVTDPGAPALLSSIATPDGRTFDVSLKNGTAFVADWSGGLKILDLTQPASPTVLSNYRIDISGNTLSVAIAGNTACVADQSAGLEFVNVSNPAAPVRVGNYAPNGWVVDVAVKDNFAFAAVATPNDGGLDVVDFSNPAAPIKVASYPTGSGASGVIVSGDKAFLAQAFKVNILNVAAPSSPYSIGAVTTVNLVQNICVSGDTLYVTEQVQGGGPPPFPFPGPAPMGTLLKIFDISVPSNPVLKTSRGPFFGGPRAFTIKDNLAFLTTSDTSGGPQSLLALFDISDPFDPKSLGSYWKTEIFSGVGVSGNFVFLSKDFQGVDLLDISDRTKPKWIASAESPGFARAVFVKGSSAYVASFSAGLQIISFADPNAPSLQLSKSGDLFSLNLTGQVGQNYHVEHRSNLGSTDMWSLLQTVTLTNTTQVVTDNSAIEAANRFYRLRIGN